MQQKVEIARAQIECKEELTGRGRFNRGKMVFMSPDYSSGVGVGRNEELIDRDRYSSSEVPQCYNSSISIRKPKLFGENVNSNIEDEYDMDVVNIDISHNTKMQLCFKCVIVYSNILAKFNNSQFVNNYEY